MRRLLAVTLALASVAAITRSSAQSSNTNPSSSHSAALPQAAPTKAEPVPVLKATTRLVVVDVVATDRHGNLVTDLKAADFKVIENGRAQKISAFELQRPVAGPAGGRASLVQPKLPPNVVTNIKFTKQPSALNVILLDGLNTTVLNQTNARRQMLKFVANMPTNQPIAVFALSQKLRMLQDFTSNPDLLKQTVNKFLANSSHLLDDPTGTGQQTMLQTLPQNADPEVLAELEIFEAERSAMQLDMRTQTTMQALQTMAKMLAGAPGRKNLIWISESFPLAVYPDSDLGYATFTQSRNYNPNIVKTAHALLDAQVAVYPVDVKGLLPPEIISAAASRGVDRYGSAITSGPGFSGVLSKEVRSNVERHFAMDELAERTGGKSFYNRNDMDKAIQNGIADGSTYYLLGYYPENKTWDGKFRKIEVKLARPGVTLRHRAGYYAADRENYAKLDKKTHVSDLAAALSLDNPSYTGVAFDAVVTPSAAETGGKATVNYAVDPHSVAFELSAEGLEHASLGCYVQAFDDKGKTVSMDGRTFSADLTAATYKQVMASGLPCNATINLPAGKYQLKLAVRDERTGAIGSANAQVIIPDAASMKPSSIENNGAKSSVNN